MVKLEILGALFLLLQGFAFSGLLAINKLWESIGWPSFQMQGTGFGIGAMGVAAGLFIAKTPRPPANQLRYVVARCGFTGIRTVLQSVAALTDAPLGDLAALSSINVIVATILGFFILGEQLRYVHILGIGCSVVGAMLVSQPSFIFGTNDSGSTAWLGYLFAVTSGCLQAFVLIVVRKQKDVHPQINNAGVHAVETILFWILPYTPLLETRSLSPFAANPFIIIGCVMLFAVSTVTTSALFCAGAKWCPAALSATLDVCSRMISGYILQFMMFGQSPTVITGVGAILMLISVVIMVSGRVVEPIPANSTSNATGAASLSEENTIERSTDIGGQDADEDEDAESLSSFAAFEFATKSPHMSAGNAPVRQRRGAAMDPEAHTMGAMMSVVAVSSI